MKKLLFGVISALLINGLAFAQAEVKAKLPEDFIKVSDEYKEAGKSFYVIDMSHFASDLQKSAFLELVYGSSQVFAVSTVKPDNTFLICAYESVLDQPGVKSMIASFRDQAMAEPGKATAIEKHKSKR